MCYPIRQHNDMARSCDRRFQYRLLCPAHSNRFKHVANSIVKQNGLFTNSRVPREVKDNTSKQYVNLRNNLKFNGRENLHLSLIITPLLFLALKLSSLYNVIQLKRAG